MKDSVLSMTGAVIENGTILISVIILLVILLTAGYFLLRRRHK